MYCIGKGLYNKTFKPLHLNLGFLELKHLLTPFLITDKK